MKAQVVPLFKKRILRRVVKGELDRGIRLPEEATKLIVHWVDQLKRGVIDRLTESSVEQTFNNEIFGKILGYQQVGSAVEATLIPKRAAPASRETPDFVLGRFDLSAGKEEWVAVGEIKDSKTDLDAPQIGRPTKETPVEQAFRYATRGKAGVEWILATNFREIRLYKNGYQSSYHFWKLEDLADPDRLFEFYALLRADGLTDPARETAAARAFRESINAGRDLTEGFYGLYKIVQQVLIEELQKQPASKSLSTADLYGKTHKLLNRILFIAFCEKHPAELIPHNTLKQVYQKARSDGADGCFWQSYKELFDLLNVGGGLDSLALNAFNGGLFAHDPYYDRVTIPNSLFTRRFRAGKGKRQSLEITGIFGFDVYDFAEDLNVQALGAIFEQSLKDIPKGEALVRGAGEVSVSTQEIGGVYYTPGEITAHVTRAALEYKFGKLLPADGALGKSKKKQTEVLLQYSKALQSLKIIDPACGSGAFLVEVLEQLHFEYERVNKLLSELGGRPLQRSLLDLDRLILRDTLFGRDILPESVEITRLSIWLRTAKKNEKLESLDHTICAGDTLRSDERGLYDIVIGNPPWGATLDGWSENELTSRFPGTGSEADSYAIFMMRAWEMLKEDGILAFIVPNSWLTVQGYSEFRAWVLRQFDILEITNVWKIFDDVNHDACILVARKRAEERKTTRGGLSDDTDMQVRAIERGKSEAEKLRRLAERGWAISHSTSHSFQYRQENHRFEVIYPPEVAAALDKIASRCQRMDVVADVTVGIQVYHHTKVSKDFIKRRGFHSTMKEGGDWYPFIDANDVQRFYISPSNTQWLHYNEKLRDKRDLAHYQEERILVQQIFWQRLAAALQKPNEPTLYLNTLFSIYNSPDIPLSCILGLINSRFASGSYERRANRLFGDKFPKVSKIDLASVPVPKMSKELIHEIGDVSILLQQEWQRLRDKLCALDIDLKSIIADASLAASGEFWRLTEQQFRTMIQAEHGVPTSAKAGLLSNVYVQAKRAVDTHWHQIADGEAKLNELVRRAYQVPEAIYNEIIARAPEPNVTWAMRK